MDDEAVGGGSPVQTWAKVLLAFSAIHLAGLLVLMAVASCIVPLVVKATGRRQSIESARSPTGKPANAVHADPEAGSSPATSATSPTGVVDGVANTTAVTVLSRQMSIGPTASISKGRAVAVGVFLCLAMLLRCIFGIVIGAAVVKPFQINVCFPTYTAWLDDLCTAHTRKAVRCMLMSK